MGWPSCPLNPPQTGQHDTSAIPRLPDVQLDELVRGYQDGASVYDLATRFGVHRATVSLHLHRAGIATRRRGRSG
jgi:DNA-directed RNA polymerase specialized sigma24 family protein